MYRYNGGGGFQINKMSGGEPFIAAAGAERGVHVLDAERWSVVKRWPTAIKFEITLMVGLYKLIQSTRSLRPPGFNP